MVVVETALFVAGLGAGLAGGYAVATRRHGESGGRAGTGESGGGADDAADTRYRTVAENFPKGSVALFDDDLRYTLATGGVFDYIEFSPEDFEGHAIADVFLEEFVDDHLAEYSAVFDGEESSFEMRHGERVYRKHLVPVTDDGSIVAGVEMTRDITELRERENALEASEQRYRTLAENFPRGSIALLDGTREFTLVAGQVFEYVDSDPEDFEGNRLDDLFLDGFVERHGPKYDAVFDGEEASFEMRHGDQFYRKHLVPVTDETGAVVHCLEMTVDITPLRERERALRESSRRYQTLAENFPRGVVALFDDDLRYTLAAGGVFDYLDLSVADFEGNTVTEVHTPGYVDRYRGNFERCLDGERSAFTFSHADRVYRTRLVPVTDDDGTIVSGMSLTTDITALKERERELQRQNDRLEEFASIVSHDLRNPLNVALGRVELIEGGEDDEHVRSIQTALDRMTTLIDDMLTLARQGRTVENPQQIELGTTVTEAWAHVESDRATLVNDIEKTVTGDPGRVMQLLENLFRNALEHGRADVTVTVGPTAAGFYVADDGPGIPESDRELVFEHGHTTNEDGTGFGLAIVENVAEAHGWTVSVTDSETGGARFEFDTGGGPTSDAEPVGLASED